MFLTARSPGPTAGRREKSDHLTVEDAKAGFARHPNRRNLEALIYVDGAATWIGECDESDAVEWQERLGSNPPLSGAALNVEAAGSANVESVTRLR